MQLTLCRDCVQPLIDDTRYTVRREETDPCDRDCFICGRHGCSFEIEKKTAAEPGGWK